MEIIELSGDEITVALAYRRILVTKILPNRDDARLLSRNSKFGDSSKLRLSSRKPISKIVSQGE